MQTCIRWSVVLLALYLMSAGAVGQECTQSAKLSPDDPIAGESFGWSMAIDGSRAVIGARVGGEFETGSAYVFDIDTGAELHELLADDGEPWDEFGTSVAIYGSKVVVGAPASNKFAGSAYVFDADTGAQLFKLVADDGAADEEFGVSVAIHGSLILVGAEEHGANGPESGAVYVFDAGTGDQLFKLLADDGQPGDEFGNAVAISGSIAIVGTDESDDNGVDSGSVYIFDLTTGTQLRKLLPDDGAAGDNFGASVAIDGHIAIIGADEDDDNGIDSGSAYLFNINTGEQLAKLLPDDGGPNHLFGYSVAISGATAIVGAWRDTANGQDSGSAYVFDVATRTQVAKLLPDDGVAFDGFGWSVAVDGFDALVGAWFQSENGALAGMAYRYALDDPCIGIGPPGDVDGDGDVDVFDLLALLGSWGPCPSGCAADLNLNGTVEVFDLLFLLGNWG